MTMTPGLRKFALTLHITTSVGWLGSVAGFLALAIIGLIDEDIQTVRAAYLAMEVIAWYVILPFTFASLLTGLIMSLGTPWGLFRHYWVLIKLLITVISTLVLLLHMQPISFMADAATEMDLSAGDHAAVRLQLVVNSGAALLALIAATVLSVFKPRGLTRYGWRKQKESRGGTY